MKYRKCDVRAGWVCRARTPVGYSTASLARRGPNDPTRMCYARPVLKQAGNASLPLLLLLVGCSDGRSDVDVSEYENTGVVCLSPRAAGGLHVQVVLNDCASFCATTEASCAAELNGSTLSVSARGSASLELTGRDCPDACQPVQAACVVRNISPGSYALRYGDQQAELRFPIPRRRTEFFSSIGTSGCSVAAVLP